MRENSLFTILSHLIIPQNVLYAKCNIGYICTHESLFQFVRMIGTSLLSTDLKDKIVLEDHR